MYPHLHAVKMLFSKAVALPLCDFRYFLLELPILSYTNSDSALRITEWRRSERTLKII